MAADGATLSGRTALVTGAAKRLGRATALALAAEGTDVVVHYGRSRKAAEDTAEDIRRLGRHAWTLGADLADPEQASGLVAGSCEQAGPLDILVNSASIFPDGGLTDVEPAELALNVQVNAMAPLALGRAFAAQGRRGDIINFLDTRITDYDRDHAAYHLSKRMLADLTRMMALEFAPGVKVNAVAPGLILPPAGKDESYLDRLASTNPLGRHGEAEDVTRAVLFLLASDFVTGQVIFVDGGRHMKGRVYG